MSTGLTLSEQFFRDQAQSGASGDLSTVLNRISLAARMIASEIMLVGSMLLFVIIVFMATGRREAAAA